MNTQFMTEPILIISRLEFWSEIRSVYKLSMDSMKTYAQKCIASKSVIDNMMGMV